MHQRIKPRTSRRQRHVCDVGIDLPDTAGSTRSARNARSRIRSSRSSSGSDRDNGTITDDNRTRLPAHAARTEERAADRAVVDEGLDGEQVGHPAVMRLRVS